MRFSLPLRNVEDLLLERGYDVSHETVVVWWNRFGSPNGRGQTGRQTYKARHSAAFAEWRELAS